MYLNLRKSWIQWFKQIVIWSWNERDLTKWRKVVQSAWRHSDVNLEKNLGLFIVIFSGKIIYGFESYEVKNPTLQTDHNLELKRGRYDQSKHCCAKSMLLRDCIRVQFFFVIRFEFWASPFGLILVEIGPFGFSFFTNLIQIGMCMIRKFYFKENISWKKELRASYLFLKLILRDFNFI